MNRFRSLWAAVYGVTGVWNIAGAIQGQPHWASVIDWVIAVLMFWWFIDEVRDIVRHDRRTPSLTIRADLQGRQIAEAIRRHNARGGAA